MSTAIRQNRHHYPALDGLRGLAILLVVIYHNFTFTDYFFFGWLGVDLFFVLSGFLITEILLRTRNSPHYLSHFYLRRVLRIFPIYYLTLLVFLILLPVFAPRLLNLDYYVQNQVWFWTYLQNWLFIFHPLPEKSNALLHLWSLAVEEQYYLVWPFVILLFKKPRSLGYLLIALLISVVALRLILWVYRIDHLSYFNLYTFSRIDGLCIGSLLAVLRAVNTRVINRYFTFIILGLAVLNFVFYFFNKQNQFSYPFLAIVGYTTFAFIFGLLVNEGVEQENAFINKLFSFQLLRFFGLISYSWYIFHWPVYLITVPFLKRWAGQNPDSVKSEIIASFIATMLSALLAWLSFHFFEKRFLQLKKRLE